MTRQFFTVCVLLALAVTLKAQPPYRIDGVHADLSINYTAGNWSGGVGLDVALPQFGNQTFIPPNQARLAVNHTKTTSAVQPAGSNFNFIGAGAGNTFSRLSQNNLSPNQLFLGLSTSGMGSQAPGQGWANWNPSSVSSNPGAPNVNSMLVEYVIEKVKMPAGGQFSAWFTSGGTPRVYASTFERGAVSPTDANSLFVPIDGHIHLNWGFTAIGRYNLVMTARTFYYNESGVLTELRSDPLKPFIFNFDVGKPGPWPSDVPIPVIGLPRPPSSAPFVAAIPEPCHLLGLMALTFTVRFRNQQYSKKLISIEHVKRSQDSCFTVNQHRSRRGWIRRRQRRYRVLRPLRRRP